VGTERARTTYNGVIAGRFLSLPFGDNFTVAAGTDADAYHFAGLDQDSASSTSHAQFRQYASTAGRWMSPDPYYGSYRANNPQSFNRYVYAKNNPTSSFDPSGLDEMEDGDGDCDNWGCAEGGGGGGGACGPTDGSCVNTTTDPDPPVDPGPDPDPGIGIGGYQTTASPTSPTAPNNANPINPCSTANPNNLDYLTTNAQQHILQNHTPGGKGPSFYVGDWTAISLFNQATLTQGYLAPPQFQRAGTYTLQWTAPPLMFPLNLIWPGPYIGTGQTGQQTGTNRLVVKTNCSTVITSYPVTP